MATEGEFGWKLLHVFYLKMMIHSYWQHFATRKKQLINLHEQNEIEDIYFFKIDKDLYFPEICVVI